MSAVPRSGCASRRQAWRGFSSAQTVAEQVDGAVRGVVAEEAQQIVCTLRGDLCAARKRLVLIDFDRALDVGGSVARHRGC